MVAATSVAAVSCGTGSSGAPAGAVDGGADAHASRDGASARPGVTVTVLADGRPLRLARVLFHDESGRILEDTATDESGRATRSPAPSMVTVQDGTGSQLITFVGIVDGDTLTITGNDALPSNPVYIGSYLVDVPGAFPAADSFKSWIGYCDPGFGKDPMLPVQVLAADDCARTGEAVLLAAVDATGKPVAFAGAAGLVPTGSSMKQLGVHTDPWKAAVSSTLEKRLGALTGEQVVYGDLSARIGREHFVVATSPASVPPDTPSPVEVPVGVADGFEVFFRLFADSAAKSYSQVIAYQASGPFVIDVKDALPLVTAASLTGASPGQFDLAWTLAAPATTTDGIIASVTLGGAPAMPSGVWTFVVPAGATSVRTPVLPQDIIDATGAPTAVREVSLLDADDVDGYRAFKQVPNTWSGNAAFNPPYPPRVGMRTRFVVHR